MVSLMGGAVAQLWRAEQIGALIEYHGPLLCRLEVVRFFNYKGSLTLRLTVELSQLNFASKFNLTGSLTNSTVKVLRNALSDADDAGSDTVGKAVHGRSVSCRCTRVVSGSDVDSARLGLSCFRYLSYQHSHRR